MNQQVPDVINGITLQNVADIATKYIHSSGEEITIGFGSKQEWEIARKCRKYLNKLRRKGYSREQCRLGFWNKIVSEAGKIDVKK